MAAFPQKWRSKRPKGFAALRKRAVMPNNVAMVLGSFIG
jgi:hypothetical protein